MSSEAPKRRARGTVIRCRGLRQTPAPLAPAGIDDDFIKSRILTIRDLQVMLDRDLAVIYGVETKALNQAVKRNAERFPESFMFQLSSVEAEKWRIIIHRRTTLAHGIVIEIS